MAPVQKIPKEDFKKQIDIVYSLLSMLNSDSTMGPNSFGLLGSCSTGLNGKDMKVNEKVLEDVMRLTFEEKYRRSICNLNGLHAIADILVENAKKLDSRSPNDSTTKTLKHTCMALTNLTYGDAHNKNTVCSIQGFVASLVKLLENCGEDLRKVLAGVVRNISWKADADSKKILRESGVVFALLKCSMETERESTLKCLLNALWNVSSHSPENKADICDYPHSLDFIVSLLTQSETIIENGGGILKNISSHIAVNDHCRQVLRKHKCLEVLLRHLQSSNRVVVANACGTLWNLSARCTEDQQSLWKLGAVGLLGNLVNCEDKAISVGSSAALKNLLLFKTNSSSLFSSCSSSPSDDKSKEGAYYSDNKRHKEKEASADSSSSSSFQRATFQKTFSSSVVDQHNHSLNKLVVSNHRASSLQGSNTLQGNNSMQGSISLQGNSNNRGIFEKEMKVESEYYGGLDESTDELIDFSTKYKEICYGSSTDQLIDKPLYSPSEHPKLYCTEDTPENYSEINGPSYHLSDLEASFVSPPINNQDKMYDKPHKTILATHRSSGSSENSSQPNSGQKSVTFSEINQTPMMFSRTTSLGSVNSFEAPSVHSSVQSVYSHRPSGVVSPSELPDSPGESMPPSPHVPQNAGGRKYQEGAVYNAGVVLVEDEEELNGEDVNDSDFSDNENENEDLLEEVIQAAMLGRLKGGKEAKKYAMGADAGKCMYAEDTIKCYRSEGTPLTFSRNDSLSSLGSKESPQRPNNSSLAPLHPKVKSFFVNFKAHTGTMPLNLTSTPSAKTIPILEDQVLRYEVEGTPDKVPPLSFDDADEDDAANATSFNFPIVSSGNIQAFNTVSELQTHPNASFPQRCHLLNATSSSFVQQQQSHFCPPTSNHTHLPKQQQTQHIQTRLSSQQHQAFQHQLPSQFVQQQPPQLLHQAFQPLKQQASQLLQQQQQLSQPLQQQQQLSQPLQKQPLQPLEKQKLSKSRHQRNSDPNDSDSSLSFDSSDAETSPLDNRLLQECIASGLPKNKRRKHKRLQFDYDQLKTDTSITNASSMHDAAHDGSRLVFSEDDDYTFSGPSTEANNTVIYRGVLLDGEINEEGDEEEEQEAKKELTEKEDSEETTLSCLPDGKERIVQDSVVNERLDNDAIEAGNSIATCDMLLDAVEKVGIETSIVSEVNGKATLIIEDDEGHGNEEKIGVVGDHMKNEIVSACDKDVPVEDVLVADKSYVDSKVLKGDAFTSLVAIEGRKEINNNIEKNTNNTDSEKVPELTGKYGKCSHNWKENGIQKAAEIRGGSLEECSMAIVEGECDDVKYSHYDVTSKASKGMHPLNTDDSRHDTRECDISTLVCEFYKKTSVKELEESRYKMHSPITSSVSEGNIKSSSNTEWIKKEGKDKGHSKSKILNFIKKSLKIKKDKPS